MRFALLPVLLLSLPPVPALHAQARPWVRDQPCMGSADIPFHHDTTTHLAPTRPGCREVRCIALRSGGQVCQCLSDTLVTIRVEDHPPGLWERSYDRSVYGPSVEVIETDLDGDTSDEIVLAVFTAQSNGMGVSHYTIYALDPGTIAWSEDSVEVEDYETAGSWVRVGAEQRCSLLKTEWINGYDPRRGEGAYLQATWLTYGYGFVPRADRPILRRRYLYSFERERFAHLPGAPFTWFRSPAAVP